MAAKSRKVLKVISGWDAVEIILKCLILGLFQLLKFSFTRLWKGHRRKTKEIQTVEVTVDPSVGTHYYIKIMGVKYHYVESGPKNGQVVLALGDAPDPGLLTSSYWYRIVNKLIESGHRIITLDLRGSGGSEGGNRVDLSPPRVVEELETLLKALDVSVHNPAIVIGHGIGGMLAWYLSHSSGDIISKLAVIDAPHPSLYWQYPPADFCKNSLYFIQWPYLPERWFAEGVSANDGDGTKWANSRACDWSGALNYVRGAAWWRISPTRVEPPALLLGRGQSAAQLVASAERCVAPTLRIAASDHEMTNVLIDFLVAKVKEVSTERDVQWRGGIMGRVLGAVAGRGRELSARLLPPPTPA